MRVASTCLVGVLAALGGRAAAEPDDAARAAELHRQAIARTERGELAEAAALFKQAFALDDDPKYECNFGAALLLLKEHARAHAALTRCVPRLAAANPAHAPRFREMLVELEAALRPTHVAVDVATAPPSAIVAVSTFPADETVVAPTVVWLPAGKHRLVARLAGHDDGEAEVELSGDDVAAGKRRTARIQLIARAPAPAPERREPAPLVDAPPPPRRSRTAAYATLGAGAGLLAGGAVVHILSIDVREQLASKSGAEYEDYLPTWRAYQYSTIGLYAAGAVTAAVGAYLYTRARSPASVAVVPTGDGAGAMIWLSR